MRQAELEFAVTLIVQDLVEDDTFVPDTAMTAANLPGWDSFTQIEFVAALESRFDVKLPLAEIETWQTLADALASLHRRVPVDGA